MAGGTMDRKEFLATLGRIGVGTCMCGAVLGMRAACGAEAPKATEAPPSVPGDRTAARAAKRMEFVDGWVPRFFRVVDEHLDEPTRRRLMAANGKACFRAYAPDMKPRPAPATPERIARWVSERGPAAGYSMQDGVITFEYVGSAETGQPSPEGVCLCPTAEAQSAATMSPTYCWCSAGYVRELHERIFGRPVNVELTQAVLMGHPRCRFRITLA
jgi:hypothetical protein